MKSKYLVFTDLDGTLLDHHTYGYEEARPGLRLLEEKGVTLVLVSSKTYDEMILLHDELNLTGPFIFENGGGIAWKEEGSRETDTFDIEITGVPADELMNLFSRVEETLGFRGTPLASMTPQEVAGATGLSLERARLARIRRASLPFLLEPGSQDIDLNQAREKLAPLELSMTRGGRFYHLIGLGATKGRAIKMVLDRRKGIVNGETITTVGIGDSENDLAMLEAVDIPFLVKRHDGTHQASNLPGLRLTERPGPGGFTEAMQSLWT